MKKTFVAAAVLGALASSAFAADVTLYGVVDLGLNYQNTKVDSDNAARDKDSTNVFKEQAGQNSGSRFGLKGTEDLGNGYNVSFSKMVLPLMTASWVTVADSSVVKRTSM